MIGGESTNDASSREDNQFDEGVMSSQSRSQMSSQTKPSPYKQK
jgi:hypothetical protein